jgi:catechol 2,3-dioxygenase-like lactoylglutathione lyase family enzyme
MHLDGFGLFVEDMAKMIRFYRDVLGFEIKESEDTGNVYLIREVISKGATSVLEPSTEPWGQRTCYIADPEGNLIEIGSWNKPFRSWSEKDM